MTSEHDWHLAQINVGRLRAPVGDPLVAEFVDALDEINGLADRSPGFVWRLQTDDGDATTIRAFDDESILINMSVWESVEALADYVYRSDHTAFLRRRREWFERFESAHMALWWVPAGHLPSVDEGIARLERLQADGPSPAAFTFRARFAPDAAGEPASGRDACPA